MHDVALPEGWFSSKKSSGWFCHKTIPLVFLNASLDSSNLNQKSWTRKTTFTFKFRVNIDGSFVALKLGFEFVQFPIYQIMSFQILHWNFFPLRDRSILVICPISFCWVCTVANLSNHSFFFRRKASGRTRGSENTRRPTRASKAPRESNDRKSAVPVLVFLMACNVKDH